MRRIVLLVAFGFLGPVLWSLRPHAEQVLDRAGASYLEDAVPPRKVAAIRAELTVGTGGARLIVTVDARGPEVEAVPGLEGMRGSNRRTCEELHRLLRDDGLRVVTRSGGAETAGTFAVGARGTLPARTLRQDGTIDFEARTPAVLPVALTAISAALGEGQHQTYFVVDEVPRLCVTTELRGGSGRILAIESLADPASVRRDS